MDREEFYAKLINFFYRLLVLIAESVVNDKKKLRDLQLEFLNFLEEHGKEN